MIPGQAAAGIENAGWVPNRLNPVNTVVISLMPARSFRKGYGTGKRGTKINPLSLHF
jgi:hypothetical protein